MEDRYAGRKGTCKQCGAKLVIPAPANGKPDKIVIEIPSPTEKSPASPSVPVEKRLSVRTRRLMADATFIEATFRSSHLIEVWPVHGEPPEVYQAKYHVQGLVRGAAGQPVRRDQHLVEIQLTRDYPRQSPKCKMLTPIFHPNIEPALICIGDHWTAGERLVDLIIRIGEMIAFQAYNIQSPLDGEAAMWTDLHRHLLPIDPRNLHPAEE